jgi:hypothetical protein
MSFVTGGIGFLITFFMVRRVGGLVRHILAFVAGTLVSLALFGVWIAMQLSGRPIGDYRTEWLAGLWAFGIAVTVALQIAAMVIASFIRKNAARSS